jgi:hypothetical protein
MPIAGGEAMSGRNLPDKRKSVDDSPAGLHFLKRLSLVAR